MKIIIAGGHGKIARLLAAQLRESGHTAVGVIRNADQAVDLVDSVVLDIENASVQEIAATLRGADATVFAAGAGGGDDARTIAVDRDAAIRFAEASLLADITRFVIVSSAGADTFDASSNSGFQLYLRAKSEADAAIRATALDWTIVRPVTLADIPASGLVTVAESAPRTEIARADVAAVVAELLTSGSALRRQFELSAGAVPITQALASF